MILCYLMFLNVLLFLRFYYFLKIILLFYLYIFILNLFSLLLNSGIGKVHGLENKFDILLGINQKEMIGLIILICFLLKFELLNDFNIILIRDLITEILSLRIHNVVLSLLVLILRYFQFIFKNL